MKTVLVVGLGEVGLPLYEILKECGKFKVYGFDLDGEKMGRLAQSWAFPNHFDIMHICLPYKSVKFVDIVVDYAKKYKPSLLIINSTVVPKTTRKICRKLILERQHMPMAHSPVRGMHKNMKKDLLKYVKYVGGVTKLHGQLAEEHFKEAGFKTKRLKSATATELAKLFNTSYRAVMIATFQEMHRMARKFGADFDETVDFIDDTNKIRKDKPIYFPDVIGGHCLIPNTELILSVFKSDLYQFVLKSNEKRKKEMKSKKFINDVEKVKRRCSKNAKTRMDERKRNSS